ncbi:SPO22-domain-containing protein [Ophiocordyceps camponoti-floridani]|uniref:SPO22-domain-containing protein n=1 Tax=Ophiocordyceps camponoti-floridani TaxID=2030778 RepID=A0A8H4Q8L6_9HYPO|nr:SPO22-domain-containing protein [Ophiocordyceps camponoti-floridani]
MASVVTAGRDRTVRSIIGMWFYRVCSHPDLRHEKDFAGELEAKLSTTRDAGAVDVLVADLSQRLQTIQGLSSSSAHHSRAARDLERRGRSLWNACIRAKREAGSSEGSRRRLLLSSRVLAFYMLELGRGDGGGGKRMSSIF